MKYAVFFCGLIFSICAAQTKSQEIPMIYFDGLLSSAAVLPPIGTFLLIRRKNALCAIKFTEIWRSNGAKESTIFHSGDESFRARYVWYTGENISNIWIIHPPKASGESEVSRRPLIGLGRLAFGGGNIHIKCGSFRLKWSAPANVYFYETLAQNEGNEFAITPWTKFEDIDPNDSILNWLQYDENRPNTVVPIK
jgi:hypothetical protein